MLPSLLEVCNLRFLYFYWPKHSFLSFKRQHFQKIKNIFHNHEPFSATSDVQHRTEAVQECDGLWNVQEPCSHLHRVAGGAPDAPGHLQAVCRGWVVANCRQSRQVCVNYKWLFDIEWNLGMNHGKSGFVWSVLIVLNATHSFKH